VVTIVADVEPRGTVVIPVAVIGVEDPRLDSCACALVCIPVSANKPMPVALMSVRNFARIGRAGNVRPTEYNDGVTCLRLRGRASFGRLMRLRVFSVRSRDTR